MTKGATFVFSALCDKKCEGKTSYKPYWNFNRLIKGEASKKRKEIVAFDTKIGCKEITLKVGNYFNSLLMRFPCHFFLSGELHIHKSRHGLLFFREKR